MENGAATSESSLAMSWKDKHKTTTGPDNSTLKRTENTRHSKTYTQMCVAALLLTAKHWKQPQCPSAGERKEKCGASLQHNVPTQATS